MERQSAKFFSQQLKLDLVELDLSAIGETFRSRSSSFLLVLTNTRQKQKLHIPIPHRNLPILSLAVSLAAQEKMKSIALSVIKDDFDKDYQSASPKFIEAFQRIVATLEPEISVSVPLREYTKLDVIKLAHELDIDLTRTYTCMRGHEEHCNNCLQCKSRNFALQEFKKLQNE